MGLFDIGKKKKKSSSSAPAKKAPKDVLSFEDHVNGAHAVMTAQDTEEFDPQKFPDNGHHLTEDIKKAFGEVSGEYTYNKYGYVLNKSLGLETPPEEFDWFKNKYGYSAPRTLLPYLKKEKHEVIDHFVLPGATKFNEKNEMVTDWSKFQKKSAVHTFYWYQLPAAEAVSVTADEMTGEIVFQDKLGRTQQMIVAQYDERRQGFSSIKIYDTQKRYLDKNFINLSYSIDWDAETKALKERAERCVERFGSLFGYRVLGNMEYFDLGRNRRPNGYVDILGSFDTPEEFLKKTMEDLKLQKKYNRGIYIDENTEAWKKNILRNRIQFLVDTPELTWVLINYVIPQFEMDNRDQRAYQNYVDTVHSIREQCNADMQKRHPGYRIPEDGANGDMQHLEDIMYCDRVNEEIEAWEDAHKTPNNPAGSMGEKAAENKDVLRQIHNLALRYAKGTMTKLEEEEDRRMRAERAVAKILNEERSDS